MAHKDWKSIVDSSWTLFLDRDGVINQRIIDGYVKCCDEFVFLPFVKEAFTKFSNAFSRIIIVSNQQGIGKGLMTADDMSLIHGFMQSEIEKAGGRIDALYVCPQLSSEPGNYRKPSPKMAFMAKEQYPEIDFSKSVMVGDARSDIEFGRNFGAQTILIGSNVDFGADDSFTSLYAFSETL